MKHSPDIPVSGQQLVADFQSVLLSRATAEAALFEAERSETQLMQQLSEASRGSLLNPSNLQAMGSEYVVKASLDAHIKKVQAEQLQSMTDAQVSQLILEDQLAYRGKRVRITALETSFQPFDAIWFDQRSGYRTSTFKKRAIEGKIDEIGFEKNLIIIKPKRLMQLINSNLQFYVAYIINPDTLKPTVEISIL